MTHRRANPTGAPSDRHPAPPRLRAAAEQFLSRGGYLIILGIIVVFGFAMRLYLATHSTYIWDEEREWIPVALSISLSPERFHVPLRTDYHGALAAYFIRLGNEILGGSHFAFRAGSILSGTATIMVVAAIARRLAGNYGAVVAALLVAVNEFHIMVSAVAIQTPYYLLFEATALLFYLSLLETRRPVYLYLTALAAALGFLTYEIGALLLPVFVLGALAKPNRWLWRSPHLYGAAILGGVLVLPDLMANLTAEATGTGYASLLDRFGALGFKPVYVAFLFRGALEFIYLNVAGRTSPSTASEYMAMNDLLGFALFLGVIYWLWVAFRSGPSQLPRHGALLMIFFIFVFAFFLLIEPPANAPVAHWIWVGAVLIPGAVLAGAAAARNPVAGSAIAVCIVLGAGLSLFNLIDARMGMKDRVVRIEPEILVGPEASMVEVTAHFDVCDACGDPGEPVLRDIGVERGKQSEVLSALATGDVAGAEPLTTDTGFALRIVSDGPPGTRMARVYRVTYDIVEGERLHTVTGKAQVPHDKNLRRPPVFWSSDPAIAPRSLAQD